MFAEEDAREREAERERRRQALFESWTSRRRLGRATTKGKEKDAKPTDASSPGVQTLVALLERFAKSMDAVLQLPGPFQQEERLHLVAAAESRGLLAEVSQGGLRVVRRPASQAAAPPASKPKRPRAAKPQAEEISEESDSPWEPPEGTRASKRTLAGKKRQRKASQEPLPTAPQRPEQASKGLARHEVAFDRLKRQRANGETPFAKPMGYWWVQDEEADRYMRFMGPYDIY